MKIAVCQLNIKFEDKNVNIRSAEKFISEASQANADIIFFPEMSFTGFSMNIFKTGEENYETIYQIKAMAKKYNISIGFGWVKLVNNKGENHYTVMSAEGTILSDYIKLHPFSYSGEDKYFNAGCELSSFSFLGKKIAVFICYDLRFPEIFQAVSDEAEIIIVAANWPEKRKEHWQKLLDARAIENQVWMLGVNCCGVQQESSYSGNSRIVMPDGKLYGEIDNAEDMIYCDISNEAETIRKSFPVKKDRRNELYKKLN